MSAAEKHDAPLPFWPAALTRPLALAYTNVSEKQLTEWEREGRVRFRPRGPRGAMIALRVDLDEALLTLFDGTAGDDDRIEI